MVEHSNAAIGCPDDAIVLDYLKNRLAEDQAEAFEQHFFACERCWQEVERGIELRAAWAAWPAWAARTERSATSAPKTRPARSLTGGRSWRPLVAAAAAVLAVGIWLQWPLGIERSEPEVLRGADERLSLSLSIEATPEAVTLTWAEVPATEVYLLEIFASDGRLLVEEETNKLTIAVMTETLRAAGSGRLLARVQALDALRQVALSSELQEVVLPQ